MDDLSTPALDDTIIFDNVLDIIYELRTDTKDNLTCDYPDCNIRSRQYAFSPKDSNRYCTYHGVKLNLKRIRNTVICSVRGCNRGAYCRVNGITKYCKKHRISDDKYSISHRTCDAEDCIKYPLYKHKSGKKYCTSHKLSDCTAMYEYRYCKISNCSKSRSYGYNGKNPEYCAEHGRAREGYLPTYKRAVRNKK